MVRLGTNPNLNTGADVTCPGRLNSSASRSSCHQLTSASLPRTSSGEFWIVTFPQICISISDIIRMSAPLATALCGGSGLTGRDTLTGWRSMASTCLWLSLARRRSGDVCGHSWGSARLTSPVTSLDPPSYPGAGWVTSEAGVGRWGLDGTNTSWVSSTGSWPG